MGGMEARVKFRELNADEIECRVGTVSQKGTGLSLLLYKTARVDADILDETVGPENWQCEFYECKGTLFCKVGIAFGKWVADAGGKEFPAQKWVWKSDAGAPSNMEAQKGEASDAFKRACFKWGIGRELYTAPFIWIPQGCCEIVQQQNGKYTSYDRFEVAKVAIEDGRLVGIRIVNAKNGQVAFSWREE